MVVFCKTIFGNRGSGKSEGLKVDLWQLACARDTAVVCFDLPGSLAKDMTAFLCAKGHQSRTYYEEARFIERTVQWPFYVRPGTTGLQRRIEEEVAIEEFCQAFWAKRGLKSGEEKPWTKLYLESAAWVWGTQPEPQHLTRILRLFDKDSLDFERMLDAAEAQEAARIFRDVKLRSFRVPNQFAVETGASFRLLRNSVGSPVIFTRHGNSWDWEEKLLAKAQVYFDLSDVTEESARALVIFGCNAIANACRRYFERTGRPLNVVIVLEEAGALDLITPMILTMMQAWRKAGINVWAVSQTIKDFKNEEVLESLLALSDVHEWYRMNSGIDRAAEDLANPTFDPMAVHYRRERMVADGTEDIRTINKGKRLDDKGHTIGTDEREGVSQRMRYRAQVEEFYKTPALHLQEFKTKIAVLQTGQRFIRDKSGVRLETVQMLGDAWPLGLTEIRLRKAIEAIRSRDCYRVPDLPPEVVPSPAPQPEKEKPRKRRGMD